MAENGERGKLRAGERKKVIKGRMKRRKGRGMLRPSSQNPRSSTGCE